MIYEAPKLDAATLEPLEELEDLRGRLGREASRSVPWSGPIRRIVKGQSWESSTSIEGFEVKSRRAELIASRLAEPRPDDQGELALACYAQAMDHVATLAEDPDFKWIDRVILDLHFETCRFQRDKSPGLYREGPIAVTAPEGGISFRGPEPEWIRPLVAELLSTLEKSEDSEHPVVAAALAHLNLISIHPFADGNGRISRILQSLVLARQGLVAPEFGSVESYLADHTGDYYDVLRKVQKGFWSPERDSTPWIKFCIKAHIQQANDRLELLADAARRWEILNTEISARGWDDRLVIALEQALHSGTDRSSYGGEARVADATASNDLRRLVDAGLLEATGRGRSTRYRPTPELNRMVDS